MSKICHICKDPIEETTSCVTINFESGTVYTCGNTSDIIKNTDQETKYECYDCFYGQEESKPDYIPTCDKCCAEEGLIIFGEDEEKQIICYGCLQDAVDNGTGFIQLDQ